jgi:hypothetical protein
LRYKRAVALRELQELREDAAGLSRALAAQRWRRAAGMPAEEELAAALRAHPLIGSRDGLQQACEALASALGAEQGAARVARLSALRDFALRARALSLDPGAAQERWRLEARPSVRAPGDRGLHGAIAPLVVDRELPFEASRDKRGELERALADAVAQQASARTAAWDAAQGALAEAGLGDPARAAAELHARGWASPGEGQGAADLIAAQAQRLLSNTEAVARDLGGWLLERHTGARAFPGGAERHDVLHLVHAPRCASAFPRGELLRTCRRWAEMLRLDLSAGGAIKLDEDERPLKRAGAHAVATDPPFEARVSLWPQLGPRALAGLLGALGEAQLALGPPEGAPPEDLWLGDAGVREACRALFMGLLREPQWLRRCAKADLGRDDERALAYAGVLDARLAAAGALAALEAHRLGGLSSRAETAHRDLYARACGAELPAGLSLRELDPWLGDWAALRGQALAARLRAHLRERHDEDWWRNPRALSVLQALWGRGGRPTVAELWAELGSDAPSVDWLCTELAEACA